MTQRQRFSRWLQWIATVCCTSLLVVLSSVLPHPTPPGWQVDRAESRPADATATLWEQQPIMARFPSLRPAPARAQTINVGDLVPLVYEALPYLPLENDYVDLDGDPAPQSTLLSRFVRYHTFVQQRSPLFRLDWKLTLADYLGENETMFADSYPNQERLQENPFAGDREAIQALTRAQREELVNTLVDLLNPLGSQPTPPAAAINEPDPTSQPQPLPGMGTGTPLPQEPQPGDAELLAPVQAN